MSANNLARLSAFSLGTSILIQAFTAGSGILFARWFGPAGRGELAAILLWPAVLVTVGNLGFVEAVTYYTAKEPQRSRRIAATALLLAAALSILIVAAGFGLLQLVLGHYGQEAVRSARLYLLWAPLTLLTLAAAGVLRGRLRMVAYNSVRITVIVGTTAGLLILLVTHQLSLISIVIVYLVANLVTLAVAVALLMASGDLGLRPDQSLIRPLLIYGLKSHAGNVSVLANERGDQMLISLFLAPISLGLYSVAVTLSSAVVLVGTSIALVAMPAIRGSAEDLMTRRLAGFVRIAFALSAIAAAAEILMAPVLIRFLFGSDFWGRPVRHRCSFWRQCSQAGTWSWAPH